MGGLWRRKWSRAAFAALVCSSGLSLTACITPPETIIDPAFDRERPGRIAVVAARYSPSALPKPPSPSPFPTEPHGQPQPRIMPDGQVSRANELLRHALVQQAITTAGAQARLRHELSEEAARSGYDATEVTDAGPSDPTQDWNPGALAARGFDNVLLVDITDLTTKSFWIRTVPRPPTETQFHERIVLVVDARARVVDARSGRIMLRGTYPFRTEALSFEEWQAADGNAITDALQAAYRALAAHVLDESFRNLVLPAPQPPRSEYHMDSRYKDHSLFVGLRPTAPKWPTKVIFSGAELAHDLLRAAGGFASPSLSDPRWLYEDTVDDLRTTLRWEPYPRTIDIERDTTGNLERLRDVRYDVRVALGPGQWPWRPADRRNFFYPLVASTDGLPKNEYAMPPLVPRTHYFWTVRARFVLDGRERTTPWGSVRDIKFPACVDQSWLGSREINQPNWCSYRFSTAAEPLGSPDTQAP